MRPKCWVCARLSRGKFVSSRRAWTCKNSGISLKKSFCFAYASAYLHICVCIPMCWYLKRHPIKFLAKDKWYKYKHEKGCLVFVFSGCILLAAISTTITLQMKSGKFHDCKHSPPMCMHCKCPFVPPLQRTESIRDDPCGPLRLKML